MQRYIALFYYPIILAMLILLITFGSIGKRENSNIPLSVLMLFALILSDSQVVADIFDYKKLDAAKEFYDAKEYNSSAEIYKAYAQKTDNAQAYYNAGNSYYREKEYLKALSAYSFARIQNRELKAHKLSNMGNALVCLGTKNTLERAIKHYEASLKIKEDKPTRENLEAVKKALKEHKKKQEMKKDEKEKEDIEYSQQKTDAKGDDADEADDTNNKNKNKKNNKPKNKGSSKSKDSSNKADSNSDKKSSSKPKEEKDSGNDESDNTSGDTKKQTEELKKRNKKIGEVENKNSKNSSSSKSQEMSDLEEAKWVKKLNSKQNTYLYRLNKQKAKNREKNEKDW